MKKIEIHSREINLDYLHKKGSELIARYMERWNVELTEVEQQYILDTSIEQLMVNINDGLGVNYWEPGGDIFLPVINLSSQTQYVKRQGFKFTALSISENDIQDFIDATKNNPDIISVDNMQEFIVDLIKKWYDSAIYYAVGSYS